MYLCLVFPQVVPSSCLLPASNKQHSAGGRDVHNVQPLSGPLKYQLNKAFFFLFISEEGNSLSLPQKGITHWSGDSFDAVKPSDIFYLCLNIRMSRNLCSSAGGTATAEV